MVLNFIIFFKFYHFYDFITANAFGHFCCGEQLLKVL